MDTSALVKLVVAEAGSAALLGWCSAAGRELVASDLVRTELFRAVRREAPDRVVRAREVLDAMTLIEIATATFETAGRLDPTVLRTSDAIHLAAALDLGDDLEGIVTYDARLADAATANGVLVAAPS